MGRVLWAAGGAGRVLWAVGGTGRVGGRGQVLWAAGGTGRVGGMGRVLWAAGGMGRVLWAAWGDGQGAVGSGGDAEGGQLCPGSRCREGGLSLSCPVFLASGRAGVISEGAVVSRGSRESGSAAVMSARPRLPRQQRRLQRRGVSGWEVCTFCPLAPGALPQRP